MQQASECDELTFLNRLDGFHLTPRISIPFDGDIDVSTVTSRSVFLMWLFVPALLPIVRDAQEQIAEFFISDGRVLERPKGLRAYWEVPIEGPLPEQLGFIK